MALFYSPACDFNCPDVALFGHQHAEEDTRMNNSSTDQSVAYGSRKHFFLSQTAVGRAALAGMGLAPLPSGTPAPAANPPTPATSRPTPPASPMSDEKRAKLLALTPLGRASAAYRVERERQHG